MRKKTEGAGGAGPGIREFFAGRPQARTLYRLVEDYVKSLGPVNIARTKTQISFGVLRKFAWVWLPQMWIHKQPEESITLSFTLPYRIRDRRIKESVEPMPGHWMHHCVIAKKTEFNGKAKGWISLARENASQPRVKKKPKMR